MNFVNNHIRMPALHLLVATVISQALSCFEFTNCGYLCFSFFYTFKRACRNQQALYLSSQFIRFFLHLPCGRITIDQRRLNITVPRLIRHLMDLILSALQSIGTKIVTEHPIFVPLGIP